MWDIYVGYTMFFFCEKSFCILNIEKLGGAVPATSGSYNPSVCIIYTVYIYITIVLQYKHSFRGLIAC
jgi:hypothetical protein